MTNDSCHNVRHARLWRRGEVGFRVTNLALYRKYRPKSFDDVVGQQHITDTLRHSLQSGRPSHAYLFTGPHGVGKTSVARILAHSVNKLEYQERQHLDIIEIDAASNRRIDEIRDLREKINIAPVEASYKVYIIDEVHMLTKEAFNALLKTLEEPPAHAIFILATTDAQKLPPTIISRTQRFSFKPLPTDVLARHLQDIARKESLSIEPEAATLLARRAAGSVRDAVSLLEQVGHTQTAITESHVRTSLGLAPQQLLTELAEATINGSVEKVSQLLVQARNDGLSGAVLARQLIDHLRGTPNTLTLELVQHLLTISSSSEPEILFETILLQHALQSQDKLKTLPTDAETTPALPSKPKAKSSIKSDESPKMPKQDTTRVVPTAAPQSGGRFSEEQWRKLLTSVKEVNNSLYAVLRMAKPVHDPARNVLQLYFRFPFHQKRFTEERTKRQTEELAAQVTGWPLKIEAIHDPDAGAAPEVFVRSNTSPDVESVIDMMGGGEVVEI